MVRATAIGTADTETCTATLIEIFEGDARLGSVNPTPIVEITDLAVATEAVGETTAITGRDIILGCANVGIVTSDLLTYAAPTLVETGPNNNVLPAGMPVGILTPDPRADQGVQM